MAVLPGGTFNYFARELGIESMNEALDAPVEGAVRTRDLGSINGRIFINNVSFGLYPRILERRAAKVIRQAFLRFTETQECSISLF